MNELKYNTIDYVYGAGLQKMQLMNTKINSSSLELIYHCAQGNMREIRRLIASGADMNYKDYDRRTALHLAVAEGKFDVVKYLVLHGANKSIKDRFGNTAIDEAKKGNHTEILSFLMQFQQMK